MDELLAGYANYASTETVLRESLAGYGQPGSDSVPGTCISLTCGVTISWTWTF